MKPSVTLQRKQKSKGIDFFVNMFGNCNKNTHGFISSLAINILNLLIYLISHNTSQNTKSCTLHKSLPFPYVIKTPLPFTVLFYVTYPIHCAKKPVTIMLTYPWKCTVLHCNHLGNTWKPLVLMT